jgi:hypothetical protein
MEFKISSMLKCPDDLTAYRGRTKGFIKVLELWEIGNRGKLICQWHGAVLNCGRYFVIQQVL